MINIKELLGENFCSVHSIPENYTYKIEYLPARDLLTAQRIDLIAKYKYVEFYDKGYDITFIKSVYFKHISAFSFGTYTEFGEEERKNTIEKYITIFHALIADIKKQGVNETISVIPVGKDNIILDGAHRTATAAYFDQIVPIIRFNEMSAHFDACFFENRYLDAEILDYLVSEYCKLKKDVYAALLWPRVQKEPPYQEIVDILNTFGSVIYKKNVEFTYNGFRNLMIQTYEQHDWVGNPENHFKGVFSQVNGCWHKNGIITFFLFENCTLDELIQVKTIIRNLAGLGNYAMHSTDNKQETLLLVNIFNNRNTIHLLNYGYPDRYIDFYKKIVTFRADAENSGIDLNKLIIDSSSVLALYGLRNAGDLDYLTLSKEDDTMIHKEGFDNHVDYVDLYDCIVDKLLFDPEKYLYFLNIKFITLQTLRVFKKNRGEKKDLQDLRLINSFLTHRNSITHIVYKKIISIKRYFYNKKNNFVRKLVFSNIWKQYLRPVYKFVIKK